MPINANTLPTSKAEATVANSQQPQKPAFTERHVPVLDGIRGLAVLLVIAQHYGDLSDSNSLVLRIFSTIKAMGWSGVDIFFALSGFLITGILWQKRNEPHRWKNFYARRALRLFPVFYGVWAVLAIYIFATHLPWHSYYFAYLFYLGNFASRASIGDFGIGHFWSLAVEEQFYIIWPLVLWKLNRVKPALYLLVGVTLFSIALKPILIVAHLGEWGYYLLPSHMEGLALGSFLALAAQNPSRHRYLTRAGRLFPLILLALAGLCVYFHGLPNTYPEADAWAIPLFSVGAAMLIWNSLLHGSAYEKMMNLSFLRFYGKYSYGLYVYHLLLRGVLRRTIYVPLTSRFHSSLVAGFLYMTVCLALLTVIAMASFHYFETPFLKLKRKF